MDALVILFMLALTGYAAYRLGEFVTARYAVREWNAAVKRMREANAARAREGSGAEPGAAPKHHPCA